MGLGAARGVRRPGRWPRHVDRGALCRQTRRPRSRTLPGRAVRRSCGAPGGLDLPPRPDWILRKTVRTEKNAHRLPTCGLDFKCRVSGVKTPVCPPRAKACFQHNFQHSPRSAIYAFKNPLPHGTLAATRTTETTLTAVRPSRDRYLHFRFPRHLFVNWRRVTGT